MMCSSHLLIHQELAETVQKIPLLLHSIDRMIALLDFCPHDHL